MKAEKIMYFSPFLVILWWWFRLSSLMDEVMGPWHKLEPIRFLFTDNDGEYEWPAKKERKWEIQEMTQLLPPLLFSLWCASMLSSTGSKTRKCWFEFNCLAMACSTVSLASLLKNATTFCIYVQSTTHKPTLSHFGQLSHELECKCISPPPCRYTKIFCILFHEEPE